MRLSQALPLDPGDGYAVADRFAFDGFGCAAKHPLPMSLSLVAREDRSRTS